MPANIDTLNNLYMRGTRALQTLRQLQAFRALRLLRSPNVRQRSWAVGVLGSLQVQRAFEQMSQINFELGQAISLMKRQQTQPASDAFCLANLFDQNGLYTTADLADFVGFYIKGMETPKKNSVQERLFCIANRLDEQGHYDIANAIDIMLMATKDMKLNEMPSGSILHPSLMPLSTRNCPDHRGTQLGRIDENVYQCPLDGKVYNYEAGYTNYKGQIVPGGSVAGQTPGSSSVAIPHTIFDSRYNVINTIN